MVNYRGLGLKRKKALFVRLTKEEKEEVESKSKALRISMDEYARKKLFDEPFEKSLKDRKATEEKGLPQSLQP